MLAIISDLHFCDGSAIDKNVKPDAFRIALTDIYDMAARLAGKDDPVHVDLVMLGDVFDLLRTERWFEEATPDHKGPLSGGQAVPVSERPWGSAKALDSDYQLPEAVSRRAHGILDAIIARNGSALKLLGQDPDELAPHFLKGQIEVRRVLLPGNHDRLALLDETLYQKMRQAIGAADERTLADEHIFRHRLQMEKYGVLARHGHEFDPWNFEAYKPKADPASHDDASYLAAPIGDPITTELVARLPYLMRQRLRDGGLFSEDDITTVNRRLQRIEDVRPVMAAIQWINHEATRLGGVFTPDKAAELASALKDVVHQLVEDFRALDFFGAWKERHSGLFHPLAEELSLGLEALEVVGPKTLDLVISKMGGLLDGSGKDPYQDEAVLEKLDPVGEAGMRFVVYGHTHESVQQALRADGKTQDTYLNSGTFRQRIFRTADRAGFIDTEHMTYLCFFSESEAATWRDARQKIEGPAFSVWNGARSR